jgi:hypothetical protein
VSIVELKGQVYEPFYADLKREKSPHIVCQSQIFHGISLTNICTNQVLICTYLLEIFHEELHHIGVSYGKLVLAFGSMTAGVRNRDT